MTLDMLAGIYITYQWRKEGIIHLNTVNRTLLNGSDLSNTYTVTAVNFSDAGLYKCNVSLSGGGEYVQLPPETSVTSKIFVISKDHFSVLRFCVEFVMKLAHGLKCKKNSK